MKTNRKPKTAEHGYDLIGDIHGYARELTRLLGRLGYRLRGGCFRHASRKAIFLGDFIDRGPQISETLRVVRSMVDEGEATAVMGNHEYNAICYGTRGPKGHLREHNTKNFNQHRATLQAFAHHGNKWRDYLQWFRRLPLFLELPGLRVVHACWCDEAIQTLTGRNMLTDEMLLAESETTVDCRRAVELLLKGKEISLPAGHVFIDKDGSSRSTIRVRWWLSGDSRTYRDLAIPNPDTLPNLRIQREIEAQLRGYPSSAPPVVIGHYWIPPTKPRQPLAPNVACLDYSVAAGGPLVAYRWQGELVLNRSQFCVCNKRKDASHGFWDSVRGTTL